MVKPVKEWVQALIRRDVVEMKAYHVADASGLLKLDAMENPFSWPDDQLKQDWLASLSTIEANRYPDPQGDAVQASLRKVMGIDPDLGLMLGNGSDEIIQLLIQAVARDGAVVLAPEPGFVMYKVLAEINRVSYQGVPLTSSFQLDINAMLDAIERYQPAIIFLAQPNNP
ncbi:MAG: aminotransferase class I/II-fold pyridoxal phosphate-dependent enzyme, partial [Pseudomonadales bacterium]|nr:aminotransferase class I/II-fold pyridoxal phosphate-dependent enzyme [Pseudomonadales bacterium]